jgi:serine protease
VITVVATQALGDRATYSNYGDGVLVSAPGGEENVHSVEDATSRGMIISTWINPSKAEDYMLAQGTSMAAPVVSGIIALMYSMQPSKKRSRKDAFSDDESSDFKPDESSDFEAEPDP